ncbi:MAG: division/cell wall cluster transcriptional repressor MraZ [Dehalococcoidia bacterium]
MLLGEYEYRIDQKGRLAIPAKFRKEFHGGVVLTRGIDKQILAFPLNEWQKLSENYEVSPFSPSKNRRLNRVIFSSAFDLELDRQGRVAIPQTLRELAQIKDRAVIAGTNKCLEIWSKELWEEEKKRMDEDAYRLAEGTEDR